MKQRCVYDHWSKGDRRCMLACAVDEQASCHRGFPLIAGSANLGCLVCCKGSSMPESFGLVRLVACPSMSAHRCAWQPLLQNPKKILNINIRQDDKK